MVVIMTIIIIMIIIIIILTTIRKPSRRRPPGRPRAEPPRRQPSLRRPPKCPTAEPGRLLLCYIRLYYIILQHIIGITIISYVILHYILKGPPLRVSFENAVRQHLFELWPPNCKTMQAACATAALSSAATWASASWASAAAALPSAAAKVSDSWAWEVITMLYQIILYYITTYYWHYYNILRDITLYLKGSTTKGQFRKCCSTAPFRIMAPKLQNYAGCLRNGGPLVGGHLGVRELSLRGGGLWLLLFIFCRFLCYLFHYGLLCLVCYILILF